MTSLAPYVNGDVDVDERLEANERANLELFGYGVKGFTLSLIETAIDVTDGPGHRRRGAGPARPGQGHAAAAGRADRRRGRDHPVLAEQHRLIVVTKGDLWNQEQKLARSGLADLMCGRRDRGREGPRHLPPHPAPLRRSTRPRS